MPLVHERCHNPNSPVAGCTDGCKSRRDSRDSKVYADAKAVTTHGFLREGFVLFRFVLGNSQNVEFDRRLGKEVGKWREYRCFLEVTFRGIVTRAFEVEEEKVTSAEKGVPRLWKGFCYRCSFGYVSHKSSPDAHPTAGMPPVTNSSTKTTRQ